MKLARCLARAVDVDGLVPARRRPKSLRQDLSSSASTIRTTAPFVRTEAQQPPGLSLRCERRPISRHIAGGLNRWLVRGDDPPWKGQAHRLSAGRSSHLRMDDHYLVRPLTLMKLYDDGLFGIEQMPASALGTSTTPSRAG